MSSLTQLAAIRRAVADYMHSEGCGCCGDYDAHKEHKSRLAALLRVPRYADGSGYDFARFRTGAKKPKPRRASRSAISGKFVTKAKAKRSPRTTVTERIGGKGKK